MQSKSRLGPVLRGIAVACAIYAPGFALALEAMLSAPGHPRI